MSLTSQLTPRQVANSKNRPGDFMLGPSDWRREKNPGGRSGKIFSKADRFHDPNAKKPSEITTNPTARTIAGDVKKLPNSAGASFRSKAPQRPETKQSETEFLSNVHKTTSTFGRAKSPATSSFKSTCDRFPFDDPRRKNNSNVRESNRQDREVLQYQGVSKWAKPSEANKASAAYKSKSDRFAKPRQLNEFFGNTPPRGDQILVRDQRPSSWSKAQGHEVFLPDPVGREKN